MPLDHPSYNAMVTDESVVRKQFCMHTEFHGLQPVHIFSLTGHSQLKISMTEQTIKIGCTDISVKAIEKLMEYHKNNFPPNKPKEIVIQ